MLAALIFIALAPAAGPLEVARTHQAAGRCEAALAVVMPLLDACDGCAERAAAITIRDACGAPIRVTTTPRGATVFVDGVAVGAAPVTVHSPIGPRRVRATAPEHAAAHRRVTVRVGQPTEIALTLAPDEADPWLLGAVAAGGAGLLASGVFGWLYLEDLDREAMADTRAARDDARDSADRNAVLAQVGLGIALIGTLTAMTLWALEDDAPAAVSLGPGGVTVRF